MRPEIGDTAEEGAGAGDGTGLGLGTGVGAGGGVGLGVGGGGRSVGSPPAPPVGGMGTGAVLIVSATALK